MLRYADQCNCYPLAETGGEYTMEIRILKVLIPFGTD
mgnify:CR=1 FL=1|jgi:hypothetical protein